ncbi:class I SAM-dependent methyltransferase [Alteribacter natronophilus]|uniref:class I SAM-dependent methyltransferase n=1 Tax=Alteribacter natronophilus TaxID=2583810 RepID=UPI00110D5E01|nr:class I SAM-dependent methyltransferase [Alteribacter natronophilus]TMW71408.1 class I SAM-dependent methyltransferase [Alteribacter natronophilus]
MNLEALKTNKEVWNQVAGRFYGRNPLPEYGPLAPTENELNLLGEIAGKKVLDLGCGSGHSLKYLEERGAAELWGIDLSTQQISAAQDVLSESGVPVHLFESPMEENPGVPDRYFDLIVSVYALGWTTDLERTLTGAYRSLKSGGTFVFSWEHPLYNRITEEDRGLTLSKSYLEEGAYEHKSWHEPAVMQQRKISTYVNTLARAGFRIEQIVEEVRLSDGDLEKDANSWYTAERASKLPTTIIFQCRKDGE